MFCTISANSWNNSGLRKIGSSLVDLLAIQMCAQFLQWYCFVLFWVGFLCTFLLLHLGHLLTMWIQHIIYCFNQFIIGHNLFMSYYMCFVYLVDVFMKKFLCCCWRGK